MEHEKEVKVDQDKPVKKKDKKGPTTLMDRIESDPIQVINQLIAITDRAMQPRVSVWTRHKRKYRRGLYYLNTTSGVPLYFTNYIFSTVETVRANITRYLPDIKIVGRGQSDDVAAEIMTKVLHDALKKAKIKKVTRAVVQHGLICTVGWFKVGYDPDAYDGEGMVTLMAVPPEDLLVDPSVNDPEEARWVIHRHRNVPLEKAYGMYGKYPKINKDDDSRDRVSDNVLRDDDTGYSNRGELRPAIEVTPSIDVFEVWVRNWDKKGPKWYICTIAGDTVLRDLEPSPFDHDSLPFVPWFDLEDDAAENVYYRGVGEVEEIEPLQDRADALDLRIYQNIALTANRQKYVSLQSGLNKEAVDNTAGRNYSVNGDPSKAVFYDNPPMLTSDVYGYRNQTELLIQTVSGVFDVTQGRRPVGITAGRAIDTLKESADRRLEFKMDDLTECLVKVCNLVVQNILQHYEGERIIRLTDADDEESVVVIDDYPEVLNPTDGEEPDAKMLDERKQWKEENGIDLVLSEVTFRWDVEASTDSALPTSKAEKGQVAADLFRLGAIDREALLEVLDFPNRKAILARLAAEATGKNAGDPMVEGQVAGDQMNAQAMPQEGMPQEGMPPQGGGQMIPLEAVVQLLTQLGVEEQMLQEVMQVLSQMAPEGMIDVMQLAQALVEMGVPEEAVQQIIALLTQGGEQQPQAPQQGGDYPPQITQ